MAIQNDNTVLCKGDLKAYHEKILPYLGGNFMLGTNVSDHYSTDEKIVGVWTDGRPLYQITYNFTMPSANVDYTVATLPTGSNPKQMFGGIEWDTNSYIEVNYYDSTVPTSCLCYIHNRSIKIMGRDQDLANRPAFITVKYTKSSDAANSAVATPGCYDILRPDLWPNNTEITFGNGLYGYKYVGTTGSSNTTFSVGSNIKKLISYGGYIASNTNNLVPIGSYWTPTNYICAPYTTNANFILMYSTSGSPYSNKQAEIWVTYTK